MGSEHPAGWFADPVGRHPMRYWDSARWTEHVSGAPVGRMRVSVTDDAVANAAVEDTAGQRVATITQSRERLSLFKVQASFTPERHATLADPLRVLAVAAPLALHCDLDVREDMQPGRRTWTPLGS